MNFHNSRTGGCGGKIPPVHIHGVSEVVVGGVLVGFQKSWWWRIMFFGVIVIFVHFVEMRKICISAFRTKYGYTHFQGKGGCGFLDLKVMFLIRRLVIIAI